MKRCYVIVDPDGIVISLVTSEERNRLRGLTEDGRAPRHGPNGELIFNQRLIQKHKKRDNLYYCLVDPSVILAELRREISDRVPIAEDCSTTTRELFSNEKGSGWFYQHHLPRAYSYQRAHHVEERRLKRRVARKEPRIPEIPLPRSAGFPLRAV